MPATTTPASTTATVAATDAAPRIGLFDMDGSLADFETALRAGLESLRSPAEPPLTDDLWEQERLPHIRERMRLIKATPGWWRSLAPIPDGMRVVEAARAIGYQVNVLTKGPAAHPSAWAEKLEWCRTHLGDDVDVHITMNKGLVYGTFLYDDFPDYMLKWLEHRPRGLGIMPDTPANRNFTHPQVIRYDSTNFEAVHEALLIAYTRPMGSPLVLPR